MQSGLEVIHILVEAEVLTEPWRRAYNQYRRPSKLGYRTPAEFAAQWSAQNGHRFGGTAPLPEDLPLSGPLLLCHKTSQSRRRV